MSMTMLPRMLQPAYQDWVTGPGEMYGFWLWTGPGAVEDQVARTGANATSMHWTMRVMEDSDTPLGMRPVPPGPPPSEVMSRLKITAGVGIGESNNAYFTRYPSWFWKLRQEAQMRDSAGKAIRAGVNPVPAMDDPVLVELAKQQMTEMAGTLKDESWLRYWVIAGEQAWPDYFGLPEGDFRPASRRHFTAWQKLHKGDWHDFRESVFTDRFANYTACLRELDPSRPVTIPTHGNPFAANLRSKLGYPLADLAGVADGFEAGPISINDDPERLIRMMLDQQTSFGIPVVAPRLANKQLDPSAKGGGRGFSPATLRRTVYEALGLGVWHIGLVQWAGDLPDGEWGISGTPAEAEAKQVFDELRLSGPWLDGCSRLQPQVGLFISETQWKDRWQDRWTLVYDQAVKRGWHIQLLTDAQMDGRLPVIVTVDEPASIPSAASHVIQASDSTGESVTVIHQTQTTTGANTWSAQVKPLDMDGLEKSISRFADLRPVLVTGGEGIESLLLTDGTNVQAILLNRSPNERDVKIEPSPQLHLGSCTMRNLITGEPITRISLQPFGTALVALEPAADPREILRAEDAVAGWSKLGLDVKPSQDILARAHAHQEAGRGSKSYALARSITHGLAFKADSHCDELGLSVRVEAWTPSGKRADRARVRMRLVPGPFVWHDLKETSPGVFTLKIPKAGLPVFYNPASEKYELASGLTQVVLDAALGDSRGGLRTVVSLR